MSDGDISALKHSLSLFGHDELGCFIGSKLFDLGDCFLVNGSKLHHEIAQAIRHLRDDLWQASAIASRLVWMRKMVREGHLQVPEWLGFARLDIELFSVQIRSALDYLGVVIASYGKRKGQLPSSFNDLRNFARKRPERLEPEILEIILSADWFDELRMIRDGLVHGGSQPIVFQDHDEWLLFQIYGTNYRNMVSAPFMLYNENVAYFQRFAAWSFAHVLSTLESVGNHIAPKFQHEMTVDQSRSYDFALLRTWSSDLLDHLQGST